MNFYNDNDPKIAAWLRQLVDEELIPFGGIDERDIRDITAGSIQGFSQHHFFCGIGGWPLALRLAGWPEDVPIWSASLPCQPFSGAGKQLGEKDERHLWPCFRNLIAECRPAIIVGEQTASALGREWLAGVRADLEALGYEVGAADLCAAGVAAPHIRQRLYWMAVADSQQYHRSRKSGARGREQLADGGDSGGLADATASRRNGPVGDAEGTSRNEAWLRVPGVEREDGGLDDSTRNRSKGGAQLHREHHRKITGGGCDSGGLGNTESDDKLRKRQSGESDRRTGETGGSGAWSHYDLIPCRDGKCRRVEPGVKPLASGLPKGVVPRGYPGDAELQATAEARRLRLHGYGNGLCVPLAAEFIRCVMEVLDLPR